MSIVFEFTESLIEKMSDKYRLNLKKEKFEDCEKWFKDEMLRLGFTEESYNLALKNHNKELSKE